MEQNYQVKTFGGNTLTIEKLKNRVNNWIKGNTATGRIHQILRIETYILPPDASNNLARPMFVVHYIENKKEK